jgi:hypothetical protein
MEAKKKRKRIKLKCAISVKEIKTLYNEAKKNAHSGKQDLPSGN